MYIAGQTNLPVHNASHFQDGIHIVIVPVDGKVVRRWDQLHKNTGLYLPLLKGIGPGFLPEVFNVDSIDGVIRITKEEAFEEVQKLAKTEGILVGISSGASLAAVRKQLDTIGSNKTVLTLNYDTGERYLSVEDLFTS